MVKNPNGRKGSLFNHGTEVTQSFVYLQVFRSTPLMDIFLEIETHTSVMMISSKRAKLGSEERNWITGSSWGDDAIHLQNQPELLLLLVMICEQRPGLDCRSWAVILRSDDRDFAAVLYKVHHLYCCAISAQVVRKMFLQPDIILLVNNSFFLL